MVIYLATYSSGAFSNVGVIDTARSVIWVKRWNSAGNFELYVRASDELLKLFIENEIFLSRADSSTVMIAESVQLSTSFTDGDFLKITGRSAESLLARRVIGSQTVYKNKSITYIFSDLLNTNVINPAAEARKIACIKSSYNLFDFPTPSIDTQYTGQDLLTVITGLCNEYKLGFVAEFDSSDQKFNFRPYKTKDRSFDQSENKVVIFSPSFGNLGNTDYIHSRTTVKNYTFVAGEGEGTSRIIAGVFNVPQPSDLNRREKWLDQRNVSSNNGDIDPISYYNMLYNLGKDDLALTHITEQFSGQVIENGLYTYGEDYELGDIVQVENEYGIKGKARITEITMVDDETGSRIYPTLSEWSV